jgi:UDP-N-acetylglucosamine/UDP-N-acetylgalactosamine diphosphorylase
LLLDFDIAKQTPVSKYEVSPLPQVYDVETLGTQEVEGLRNIGLDAVGCGTVAAVIMSGGQGTRLGYPGPKGMYCIEGLPSGKCIFQIHIEKVQKVRMLAAKHNSSESLPSIPIYIMTSDLNTKDIVNYFTSKNFFGYPSDDVFFFEQSLQPCLTFDGKIIVESAHSLSLAPDGNGGLYQALQSTGALDDMIRRNVQHLHIYGIDNILTKSVDPTFIGLCINTNSECGNKVVWRANAAEKVGVTACRDDRMCIIEYSEIPPHLASVEDPNGKLLFGAANICNHYMSLQFVRFVVLPSLTQSYHIANKKIPYYDPVTSTTVTPTKENGVKLEMFIFDVFPLATRWVVVQGKREDEFAPVKNAPGSSSDSPDTAREMMSAQGRLWLTKAGAVVGNEHGCCEVSPLLSYEGEGLSQFSGVVLTPPFYLE